MSDASFSWPLPTLLSVAAILTGTENKGTQSSDVATVLKSRLVRTHHILGQRHEDLHDTTNLSELQYMTAKESLCLVERLQAILDPAESDADGPGPPDLGTRDLSQVRTLLSLVFKWAVQPLFAELELDPPRPSSVSASGKPHIIGLAEHEPLPLLVSRLLHSVFTAGDPSKIRQTWITTSILNHHAVDVLAPGILLGWFPKPEIARAFADIKDLCIRFINLLPTHQAIAALGAILSSATTSRAPHNHLPKTCGHLLSNQLKRPDGVRGLCLAVFSEDADDSEAAPLDKVERIARILRTVPSNMKAEAYLQSMVPRVLDLLLAPSSEQTPSSHKRAAAFTLSRMISPTFQHSTVASSILLPLLHEPFHYADSISSGEGAPHAAAHQQRLSPADALKTLESFLLHTDPSPTEVSTLLTPIVPELYMLLALHRANKIVDPTVRESLHALLNTWGRIVGSPNVVDGLCRIIGGEGGDWALESEGFKRRTEPTAGTSISLLTAAELERGSSKDVDIDANPFNLRPDPSSFVGFLKGLDRKDVASEVFVRLLNEYRELKETDSDPMRTLLCLQLILQVQSQLSAAILSMPAHVLSFIKHALASVPSRPAAQTSKATQKRGLGLADLRIIEHEDSNGDDSDDEDAEGTEELAHASTGKDEIVETAITLLLSILEGNPEISPNTAPDLNDILAALDTLTSHTSTSIRQLAREARLVLTARTASTSSSRPVTSTARPTSPDTASASAQEQYQTALKLLQDPIIPVRAHGLQILRDLVASPGLKRLGKPTTAPAAPRLDPALVPGILSVFLLALQDDEPFLFLNAVQGLAALVDGYGRDVLRGLVDVYLRGTGLRASGGTAALAAAEMTTQELDARVRVGEALSTVVRRCGRALGLYADILVPPLLAVLRAAHLPATLRTSALAILAQCVSTYAHAVAAYTPVLADACVELVQVESVAAKSRTGARDERRTASSAHVGSAGKDETAGDTSRQPEPTDVDPVTTSAKVASFRRSALHLLSQLLRAHTAMVYDARRDPASLPSVTLDGLRPQGETVREVPEAVLRRADLVLGYVAATDEDAVARVMAREALEFVEQYREATLGL